MPGAHAGGKVEGIHMCAKFFVQGFGGLGGIEDEETAFGCVLKNMRNKFFFIQGTDIFADDTFEVLKKGRFVLNDFGDFIRRNADIETVPSFQCGLSGGAQNGGGVKIMNKATESSKDGME